MKSWFLLPEPSSVKGGSFWGDKQPGWFSNIICSQSVAANELTCPSTPAIQAGNTSSPSLIHFNYRQDVWPTALLLLLSPTEHFNLFGLILSSGKTRRTWAAVWSCPAQGTNVLISQCPKQDIRTFVLLWVLRLIPHLYYLLIISFIVAGYDVHNIITTTIIIKKL